MMRYKAQINGPWDEARVGPARAAAAAAGGGAEAKRGGGRRARRADAPVGREHD